MNKKSSLTTAAEIAAIVAAIIAFLALMNQLGLFKLSATQPDGTSPSESTLTSSTPTIVAGIPSTESQLPTVAPSSSPTPIPDTSAPITGINNQRLVYYGDKDVPNPTPGHQSFDWTAVYISKNDKINNDDIRIADYGRTMSPAWSPFGDWIAYVHDAMKNGNWISSQIEIVHPDGTDRKVLGGDYFASTESPSWSPNGFELAFSTFNPSRIGIVNIETGKITYIANKSGETLGWSPDGQRIVFIAREGKDVNDDDGWVIYVINRDGTGLQRLTNPNDSQGEYETYWSADGHYIVFNRFTLNGGTRGPAEVWITRADGSDMRKLASTIDILVQYFIPYMRTVKSVNCFLPECIYNPK